MAFNLPNLLDTESVVSSVKKKVPVAANLNDPLNLEQPASEPFNSAEGARKYIGGEVSKGFDQLLTGSQVATSFSTPSGAKSPDVKVGDAEGAKKAFEMQDKPKATKTEVDMVDEKTDLLTDLETYARDALTATDDPNATRIFNMAITKLGKMNAAEMDAMQMRINQNPALKNQGAGYAMLDYLAMQHGAKRDDLINNLTIEAADRVRELNQWGWTKSLEIWKAREENDRTLRDELLATGDISAYADKLKQDTGIEVDTAALEALSPATKEAVGTQLELMEQAIQAGNPEQARVHFDIAAGLAPDMFAGADFDSMGFADQAYMYKNETREEIEATVRVNVGQGDWDGARTGILQLHPDEQSRINSGKALIQDMDISEINEILQATGGTPIEDKSQLIGDEGEFFIDSEIARIKAETETSTIDLATRDIMNEMKNSGYDITDPDMKQAIRQWVFELDLGDFITTDEEGNIKIDTSKLLPPWNENSRSAHLFTDWPVYDDPEQIGTGTPLYDGWHPVDAEEAPGENLKYQEEMDRKWEQYLATTPTDEQMTRKNWFYTTKGGTVVAPKKEPGRPEVTDSTGFEKLISGGFTPTAEDIKVLASMNVGDLPYGSDWSKPEFSSVGNYVNLGGTGFKIEGGFEHGGKDLLILTGMDGQVYALRGEGDDREWYKLDSIPDDPMKISLVNKVENPAG